MSIQINAKKNELLSLWEKLQGHIRERFIVQGFNLFLKRRVAISEATGAIVTGEVKGKSSSFHVQLHLRQIKQIRCSCPHNGKCRHAAALFFYLYTTCGRPEMLIQEFYKEVAKKQKDQIRDAKKDASRTKAKRVSTSEIDQRVDQWHHEFSEKVVEARILNETDPMRLKENILRVLDTPEGCKEEPKLIPLYRFNIYIFVLAKIEQMIMNARSAIRSTVQEDDSFQSVQAVLEEAREPISEQGWQSFAKVVNQTAHRITNHVLQSNEPGLDWIRLYHIFIVQAANTSKRLERERLRVEGILETSSKRNPNEITRLQMMLAYIELIEGNDRQALHRVKQSGSLPHSFIVSVLNELMAQEAWERMAAWLSTETVVERFTEQELSELAPFWNKAAEHLGLDDAYEHWLKRSLPQSLDLYSSYLFTKQRYAEWIELKSIEGLTISEIDDQQLHEIEQKKPQLLLPLYHHEVERLILQKRRDSYKEAVERLKILQRLYVRIGQSDRFQYCLELISDKYKPYQALREEMTKGNLFV